ncbi:MAG: phosphonate C-P lyase system protein PhnH [Devosia sp.]|nr:phosphonate C-P lyase system protein PhnH [Devosia sp.]
MDAELSVEGGFADPVVSAQRVFRALMDAMARPGAPREIVTDTEPPAPLTRELAAVALTLADHDTPVWLAPQLAASAAVVAWLRFHTGAPIVADPATADFALAADLSALPPFHRLAQGTDEYPDRSTTLVLALPGLMDGAALRVTGPGIKGEAMIAPLGLSGDFIAQWAENRTHFPRGIDLMLVADGQVIGLPRTTRIAGKEA